MAQALTGQVGTWLILGVRADAPPTGVQIREDGPGGIAVGVLVDCQPGCPTTAVDCDDTYYLVPVRLAEPLAGRLVFDGERPVF